MKLGASSVNGVLNEGIKIIFSFWFAVVLVGFNGYPARSDSGLSSYDVLRSLVSTAVVAEGATEDELLHNGIIQKRTAPVRIYFVSRDADKNEAMKRVVETQINPLLASISSVTRLKFEQVASLAQADTAMIFADSPMQGLNVVDQTRLFEWFGAPADTSDTILEPFKENVSKCLRFWYAPEGEILRAVGFVSTDLPQDRQENCAAKNLLFSIGLTGPSTEESAKDISHSSRSIGTLDVLGLKILYNKMVVPGMKLEDAVDAAKKQ